jgi:hypothetical protein
MKLVLLTLVLAVLVGLALGGRWSNLGRLQVRWPAVALVGLALQLAPLPGRIMPMAALYASFGLLIAFAAVNLRARVPGFALILVGVLLNLAVISVNGGMPVTRQALEASHQLDTLEELVQDGGAKHHLAGPSDRLLFLGDVIALPPIEQAVSVGDLFTYAGVVWLVVAGMLGRSRRREPVAPVLTSPGGTSGVG